MEQRSGKLKDIHSLNNIEGFGPFVVPVSIHRMLVTLDFDSDIVRDKSNSDEQRGEADSDDDDERYRRRQTQQRAAVAVFVAVSR